MSSNTLRAKSIEIQPGAAETYQCPYCDRAYDHEWCTRIHITWCDDSDHQTHDGLMPETPVEVIKEGERQEITRAPEKIDIESLEPADLPDSLSETQKHIVLVAMNNPYAGTYRELHDRVERVFEEFGRDPVSYQTVRRTMQEFFEMPTSKEAPNEVTVDSTEESIAMATTSDNHSDGPGMSPREQYRELTEKQRSVIDARLNHPDASATRLAELAETSRTYPYKILDEYEDLIVALQDSVEGVPTSTGEDESADTTGDASVSNPESPADGEDAIDRPITSATDVFTASPGDVQSSSGSESETSSQAKQPESSESSVASESAESSEPNEGPETPAHSQVGSSSDTSSEASPATAQPSQTESPDSLRSDVEQLRNRVAFIRRIAEREGTSNPESNARLALAKEIEAELEAVLGSAENNA